MSIRPFFVELVGIPEVGRNFLIEVLAKSLSERYSLKVASLLSNSCIVPDSVPTTDFDYNLYSCFSTLTQMVENNHSQYNVVLIENGYLGTLISAVQRHCSQAQLEYFSNLFRLPSLKPDFILACSCSPKVAVIRGEGFSPTVTEEYWSSYNSMLKAFIQKVAIPTKFIDTSTYSPQESISVALYYILTSYNASRTKRNQ